MAPQKVVLHGARADHADEVEFGPFTQGVVFGPAKRAGMCALFDVASSREIAVLEHMLGWVVVKDGSGPMIFNRVFVQTYPSDSPTHDALTVSRRDQAYSDVHEDGEHVLWAKHAQAELYVAARHAGYDHDGASRIVDHLWVRESA